MGIKTWRPSWIWKKPEKNEDFTAGKYPACDMLNNSLRYLFSLKIKAKKLDAAINEIYNAIISAGGYFHEDVWKELERRGRPVEESRKRHNG